MKLSIKNWKEDERPREKLIQNGASVLSDSELIAIIIRSGTTKKDAVEISRDLLQAADNSIQQLEKFTIKEITAIEGFGETKAVSILAAIELGRRSFRKEDPKLRIQSSVEIATIFKAQLGHLSHEEFWVVYLNRNNRIIRKERISTGGTCATVVDLKILAKKAVDCLAQSLIIVHNHPSGNLTPGKEDRLVTKNIAMALKLFDIHLLDHIIVSKNGYFSFADEGLL